MSVPPTDASPIFTPAIFHSKLPPWAQQTPSPSPVIRGPSLPEGFGRAPVPSSPGVVTQELLQAVCAPFIEQMLVALQRAIEAQIHLSNMAQAESQQATQRKAAEDLQASQRKVLEARGSAARKHSSCSSPATVGSPFDSLFDPAPPASIGPVSEEAGSASDEDRVSALPAASMASLSVGESVGGSPGSHLYTSAMFGSTNAGTPSSLPLSSTPQEQASHAGSSPATTAPRGASLGGSSSPESAMQPGKSVMVCRHWKSKGMCRLEGECKFLHPEHKRGTGARKGGAGRSTGDVGGSAPSVGDGKSRRANKGRAQTLPLAAAVTPGPVPMSFSAAPAMLQTDSSGALGPPPLPMTAPAPRPM